MAAVTKVIDRQLAISTQSTQAWKEAASITLTEDGDWLVLCSFEFGVDSNSTNGEVRLQQDNSTELQYAQLEDQLADPTYKSWFWITRVTRSGSDVLLDLDFEPMGSVTARIRNRILMALKLDDMGTEDTDWRWNYDATEKDINTTWTDLLTESWTPGTEEDWLIIANAEWQPGSTIRSLSMRLDQNAESNDYDETLEEGEDTAEWRWWNSIRLLTLPTSAQTFKIQGKEESSTTHTARRMRFFAVRKAVFDQVVQFRDDSYTGAEIQDIWYEKLDAYFTPNQQEDVLILGHCQVRPNATGYIQGTRIHEEETDELMSEWCATADATDDGPISYADVKNWNASLQNADLDVKKDTTSSPTFGNACVIFVSLTLAEVGPSPGWNKLVYTSEPPTANAWNQLKRDSGTGWKKLWYDSD